MEIQLKSIVHSTPKAESQRLKTNTQHSIRNMLLDEKQTNLEGNLVIQTSTNENMKKIINYIHTYSPEVMK